MKKKIAYFISPHGFGHAARSAAIMESLNEINNNIEFEIFTKVPEWFFRNSNIHNFNYSEILTDIGIVQITSLEGNMSQTIHELNQYFPLQDNLINEVSDVLQRLNCELVICDISPLGVDASKKAGLKSVLVENFTWDWIYDKYDLNNRQLNSHIEYLKNLYSKADYRVKTKPACYDGISDILTNPVSRKPKTSKDKIRESLKIDRHKSMVMVTMGGINTGYYHLEKLYDFEYINFVIPGVHDEFSQRKNLILLPHNSGFYHPDLINASDAVIGKLGYSTLAEVYNAGKAFGYITRDKFPESVPLENFIETSMKGLKITAEEFVSGKWTDIIEQLLFMNPPFNNNVNGADQAALFINNLIDE